MTARSVLAVAVCCSMLAGCAVGPDYRAPAVASLGMPQSYTGAGRADVPGGTAQWWTAFGDPVLTALVERATADNLDIAQAASRLAQAREALVQTRASQLPTVDASAGAGRNFDNGRPDSSSFSGGLDASWSADLFGGLRRATEASRADYEAAGFGLADVRIATAAEVARNYVSARALQTRLAIARDTLRTQDDNLEIAGFRVQAGLVSSLDVEQARTQRAQTAATIPSLQASYRGAANRLSVLAGQAPGAVDAMLSTAGAIPEGPASIAVGVPADTLRQRPDVRASERALAAATARIGVAKAQLFPALGISGNVGTSALRLGSLGDVITGGLFANIAQAIFDGGRRRSQVRGQEAAARGAFAAYKSSVLTALEDVENALVSLKSAQERFVQQRIAADASNNAAILARSQYRAGLSDFQTLLDAERSLLSARDSMASAKADEATALVQLYLALGGGWDFNSDPTNAKAG